MSRIASSFFVKCPHCDWFGRIPSSAEPSFESPSTSGVSIIRFYCPGCQLTWRARVIGDDVESLPVDDLDEDQDSAIFPPVELGVGD